MVRTPPSIRRVVTGHDGQGRSIVVSDAALTEHRFPSESMISTHIWATGRAPADMRVEDDGRGSLRGTAPAQGGTRIGILDIAPSEQAGVPHRTDTIDYVICTAGEVEMQLDDTTVRLKSGDILIQKGTMHAWINRARTPARLVFVLIDGEPKREGSLRADDLAR
jgi:quercetin dioxygenase-like cupin family protein